MFASVTAEHIEAAAQRLAGVALHTRLLKSKPLSALAGGDVWLKLENEQRTGSFKIRGAYNYIASLSREAQREGVVAASAGNHGLGCAYAARAFGVACMVFVPVTAPAMKKAGIRELGATIDDSAPNYDAAHALAVAHAERTGAAFISPQDGDAVFGGQGTVGLEVLADLPSLKSIVVSVGGGGLVGGIGRYLKTRAPGVRVVGVQSDQTNAMAVSVAARRLVEVPVPPTLADGLAGQLFAEGLEVGLTVVDEIHLATETEIGAAIAWMHRTHALTVEGAGAVGVAALRAGRLSGLPTPSVIVVCGANIDADVLAALLRQYPDGR